MKRPHVRSRKRKERDVGGPIALRGIDVDIVLAVLRIKGPGPSVKRRAVFAFVISRCTKGIDVFMLLFPRTHAQETHFLLGV